MSARQTLTPMRTGADYEAALKQAEHHVDAEPDPDSPEGAHFEALVTLMEAWEARHQPVPPPDPIEAIKFRMQQAGLTPRDLQPAIGGLNRVYEVLHGKRGPSLAMVRTLHTQFGVALDASIGV